MCTAQMSASPGFPDTDQTHNLRPSLSGSLNSSLSGVVQDSTNHPISGARVDVIDPASGKAVASVMTYPNGSFEFRDLPGGHYEIVASSGIEESRSPIDVFGPQQVSVRVNTPKQEGESDAMSRKDATVSVSQLQVPGKARKFLEKARQAFNRSHLQEASGFVEKALSAFPNYAQALTLRGILHLENGDMPGAKSDLEKSVQLDASDSMSLVALSTLYNTEGNYKRALQLVDRAITLAPNCWQAYLEQAKAQMHLRQYKAASVSLDRAEKIVPEGIGLVHLWRGQLFISTKNYPAATTELQAYLERQSNAPDAQLVRNTIAKLQTAVESAKK